MKVTCDQGSQFEGKLFKDLNSLLGTQICRVAAYNPKANGLVERSHRTLKQAIMCHQNKDWVDALPLVLLGLRTTMRKDLQASVAQLVYGSTLRLPGNFLGERGANLHNLNM